MEASGHDAIQHFLDLNPDAKARFDEQLAANPAFRDAVPEKTARERGASDGDRPR